MYYKPKQILFFVLILISFISCGSQSRPHDGEIVVGDNTPIINDSFNNSFEQDEKDFLYNLFLTEYYWSEHTPRPFNSVLFTDPQSMIDALTYKPIDRWSYADVGNVYGLYEQSTYGFGFYTTIDISGTLRIAYIDIDSPAQKSGFYRGDKVIEINTQPATQELFDTVVGYRGKVAVFHIERNGIDIYLSLTPQYYNYNVAQGNIINTNQGKSVGYLRFDSFTDNATEEIEPIFNEFYKNNIDTLVIDMRYNGGGYLNTASILLDKLTRNRDRQVQFKSIWNIENSDKNSIATFETDANSLDLKQVLFLVTDWSASASETVINAISASSLDIDVALIGSTTHGKPVGMMGKVYNNNIYYLINFKVENSDGFSDYFNGLPVTCPAIDDITHQMGDVNETMLKEALYYIDTGAC